jgi:hypothetical protein
MDQFKNISHVYRGLLLRNRAFASFKDDEKELIFNDIKNYINPNEWILDPMSGYGGGMLYFGTKGYNTYNIEINPPAYYWQILTNPQNNERLQLSIRKLILQKKKLPKLEQEFSISDSLFTVETVSHVSRLFDFINNILKDRELSISILLPFVSRFANYQRSSSNITHFIEGGFCSFAGWENDFEEYLQGICQLLSNIEVNETRHINSLGNIFDITVPDQKFDFFITSPPYPNYRDYSKLFKIENWILDNVLLPQKSDFKQMIGSNIVSGKKYGDIESHSAKEFLQELLEKSKKQTKKAKYDIEVYYYPYFSLYFYDIQEAYKRVNTMLSDRAMGYIVVNDNITRDIAVPVGKSICDIFSSIGFKTENYKESQISHFGNIGRSAKRINSRHTRHILKVWKES